MTSDASVLLHYLAPLQPLLAMPEVTELVVNRPGEAGVESAGRWTWHEVPALSFAWLSTLATAAAAYTRQDIGEEHPICSTVLPGGERCQVVIPPAVPSGSVSLTLRKPSHAACEIETLAGAGLFDASAPSAQDAPSEERQLLDLRDAGDWPGFLRLAVRARRNILLSGATGSGKTTLAKALVGLIPSHERLVTIEDARELIVPHRNAVHLLYAKNGQGRSKAGPKALLEAALRMRPDRILLHELRDDAAFFFLRNVASGHPGSITTIHAGSPSLAFEQLSLLIRESEGGRHLSREDIGAMLTLLVDVVVQLRKVDGRFRMTQVHYDPARQRRTRL